MMKVSIIQPELNIGVSYSFKFLATAEALDVVSSQYSVEDSIEITGEVVHTGKCYRVAGNIYFRKSFRCDYCLDDAQGEQRLPFAEEFCRQGEAGGNDDVVLFSGDFIDITELVRETILLSEPLNHICSPDCLGLCSRCGANHNQGECGCDRSVIDPRLAALQELLKS